MPAPAAKKPTKPPVLEAPSVEIAKPGVAKVPEVKQPPVVVEAQPQEVPPPPEPPKAAPKKPARAARKSPGKQPATPAATAPATVPAESVPAPDLGIPADAPKLGEVISPEQRTQVQMAFEISRAEARKALTQLDARKLNHEQSETAARARNFLSQAERLQETDLRTAAQLARRAQLLALDLLKEFN